MTELSPEQQEAIRNARSLMPPIGPANPHDQWKVDAIQTVLDTLEAALQREAKLREWVELTPVNWHAKQVLNILNAYQPTETDCPFEGCPVTDAHYHRDTLDGEEIVFLSDQPTETATP